MPQMGVSVSEGTVTKWLKHEGEQVEADEPLLEISTDKVDTEVPSPGSGTLVADPRPGGRDGRGRDEDRADRRRCRRARARSRPGGRARARRPTPAAAAGARARPRRPSSTRRATAKFVSPVVARIASEHGVDPNQVPGTGRGGRVTKKDILAFVEQGAPAPATPAAQPAQPAATPAAPAAPDAAGRPAAGRRDGRARDGDAARHRRAHAPLARHLRARDERDRGRHVEGRRRTRGAEEGVPVRVRRQPDVPRVHRARDGRHAPRLSVRQRRAARRLDRHAQLRQPRHRGRARRRQGPDRPGDPQRGDDEPARDRESDRRPRVARARQEARPRRRRRAARSRSRIPAATAPSTARR